MFKFCLITFISLVLLATPLLFGGELVTLSCNKDGLLSSFKNSQIQINLGGQTSPEEIKKGIQKLCGENKNCFRILNEHAIDSIDLIRQFLSDVTTRDELWTYQSLSSQSTADLQNELSRLSFNLDKCHSLIKQIDNERSMDKKLFSKMDESLTIKYPFKGMNRAQIGSNYDPSAIRELVRLSIANGVDPYFTIAIKLLEMPPNKSAAYIGYRKHFGVVNMDAIAVYDKLKCIIPSSTFRNFVSEQIQKRAKDLKAQSSDFDARAARISKSLTNGTSPRWTGLIYQFLKKEENGSLEAFCKTDIADGNNERDNFCKLKISNEYFSLKKTAMEADRDLQSLIDTEVKKSTPDKQEVVKNILSCAGSCYGLVSNNKNKETFSIGFPNSEPRVFCSEEKMIPIGSAASFTKGSQTSEGCCANVLVPKGMTDNEAMVQFKGALGMRFLKSITDTKNSLSNVSAVIQKFNGVGCLGCTEGVNSCYSLLHASDRPIYGARAADLMINSVMANPEIQQIVREIQITTKQPIKSIFCSQLGEGNHTIDSAAYYNEQKKFLLDGQDHLFKTKLSDGTFNIPQTPNDKSIYEKRERDRQQVCSKYFN